MFGTKAQRSNNDCDPVATQVVPEATAMGNLRIKAAADNTTPIERREAYRHVVKLTGTIKFCPKCGAIPCIVHDISETGARLLVNNVIHIPSTFTLTIEREDFSAKCVVVRRGNAEVGVIFQSARW